MDLSYLCFVLYSDFVYLLYYCFVVVLLWLFSQIENATYYGDDCECDNFNCPRGLEGLVCSGEPFMGGAFCTSVQWYGWRWGWGWGCLGYIGGAGAPGTNVQWYGWGWVWGCLGYIGGAGAPGASVQWCGRCLGGLVRSFPYYSSWVYSEVYILMVG